MKNDTKNKTIDLKSMFEQVIDRTKDLQSELERLYKIEDRINDELDDLVKKIIGLEKSQGYSSISYEARNSIKEISLKLKHKVNRLAHIVGKSIIYTGLER